MTFKVGDKVDVFDPDEELWYAGVVDDIGPIDGDIYYTVQLDIPQKLSAKSFTVRGPLGNVPDLKVMAIPVQHTDWIRHPR